MKAQRYFISFIGLMVLCLDLSAEMLISPTRAYLSSDQRSTSLILRNTSDGSRTYRLLWEDKKRNAEGKYETVAESEEWPRASGIVRFSPRQITVGAGENQTVRLSYRPPADLVPGEYRSHLKLQVVAESSEPTSIVEMDGSQEGVNFRLFMQMSFSIPVIVRHEVEPPEVSISRVEVSPASGQGGMSLQVTLNRSGEASSYGNLVVEMQRDQSSPVELIGKREELYVFHEVTDKVVNVPLKDTAIPAGAWIRIAYEGAAEYDGRLWAERVFQSE